MEKSLFINFIPNKLQFKQTVFPLNGTQLIFSRHESLTANYRPEWAVATRVILAELAGKIYAIEFHIHVCVRCAFRARNGCLCTPVVGAYVPPIAPPAGGFL